MFNKISDILQKYCFDKTLTDDMVLVFSKLDIDGIKTDGNKSFDNHYKNTLIERSFSPISIPNTCGFKINIFFLSSLESNVFFVDEINKNDAENRNCNDISIYNYSEHKYKYFKIPRDFYIKVCVNLEGTNKQAFKIIFTHELRRLPPQTDIYLYFLGVVHELKEELIDLKKEQKQIQIDVLNNAKKLYDLPSINKLDIENLLDGFNARSFVNNEVRKYLNDDGSKK